MKQNRTSAIYIITWECKYKNNKQSELLSEIAIFSMGQLIYYLAERQADWGYTLSETFLGALLLT